MSRMKSLTTWLAMAMVVALVSFAHAQTSSSSATTSGAKKTTASATKTAANETKPAAVTTAKEGKTTPSGMTGEKKMAGETKKESAAKASAMAKVDLNTASKEELMKVPGIAEATADKIIAGRPWKMKSDLVKKGVMNSAMYKKASPYMIAKAAK